jgi:UDP-GlcNAc:undecaprenyl-phosphate GlcNAc-1-phosphate transferase
VLLMGMCLGFLPHNMHPARIFMGDSGSMLIGLVLAAGAVSITGQVDPDLMVQHTGSERSAVHAMVPLYMPLLLPLTIIAIPMADLLLAIARRTWNGQSPFAADRGHLHHRLLDIGHSHSRAVLIMYFWSGLVAFGAVAYSVHSASMWIVLVLFGLSAVGLVLLLLPRFSPRAPHWAERLVPPRYRHAERAAEAALADAAAEEPVPARVTVGVSGANGATALDHHPRTARPHGTGGRHTLTEERPTAESSR